MSIAKETIQIIQQTDRQKLRITENKRITLLNFCLLIRLKEKIDKKILKSVKTRNEQIYIVVKGTSDQ